MKRFIVMIFVLTLIPVSALFAQDTADFNTIPLESLGANFALSPDGQTLAVYNNPVIYNDVDSGTPPELIEIRLFDMATGEQVGSLTEHSDWVSGADFGSDSNQLVTLHRNGDVILWDVAQRRAIKTIATYAYGGGWLKALPDGKTVLLRLNQFVLAALDTETGAITHLYGRHMPSFGMFSEEYTQFPRNLDLNFVTVAASPDGSVFATSTGNDEVLLVDAASGEMQTLREPSEQPGRFAIRQLFFSTDGSTLTYFDQTDGQVHRWDVEAGEEIGAYALAATAFTLAPDGMTIAWADRETNTVYWVNNAVLDAREYRLVLPDNRRIAPSMTQLAFTPDMRHLIVSGLFASESDNAIYLIDLSE